MAYIALFDVLGFKRLVRAKALPEMVATMSKVHTCLRASVAFAKDGPDLRGLSGDAYLAAHAESAELKFPSLGFSDSFLMYSPTETDHDFHHIVLAANKFVCLALLGGLLVRGAVTKGDLHVSDDSSLFVGEGLVRAYELEQRQDWLGGILDPDRIEVPDVYDPMRNICESYDILAERRYILMYDVPMKAGSASSRCWCLGWPAFIERMPEGELIEFLAKEQLPTSDSATRKHANTVEFFRYHRVISKEPLDYTTAGGLRFKVRRD